MMISNRNVRSVASERVLATLADRINLGTYVPGTRLPGERDLATEFNVDRSVVRVALVALEGQKLIVREPGRRPWVRDGSTGVIKPPENRPRSMLQTIALVLPQHESDQASRQTIRGISHALRSHEVPYRPLIFDMNLRTEKRSVLEREACAAIDNEGIVGAIVWPTLEEGSLEMWRRVREQGHPVVFVDRYDPESPCDFVGIDNHTAAKSAVEYLLQTGHTRIVHLTNDQVSTSARGRVAGYREAMDESGNVRPSRDVWAISRESQAEGIDNFIQECLRAPEPPTAVFTLNDHMAHQLIGRLEKAGICVPVDISVIGFDDEDVYSPRPAVLTTVRQPFEQIGYRAAELLLRRIAHAQSQSAPLPCEHILYAAPLIVRSTCRSLSVP